jgi:hypothetical protein
MSPGPSARSSRTASQMACAWSLGSSRGRSGSASGRYRTSTGYVRPDTSITGASQKCFEKRSGSIVAEVMMTLRSGRVGSSRFR